jgi:hypothetical protein
MNNDKTGGAAFPYTDWGRDIDIGMTLRDYFAGQAIAGFDWEFAEFDQNAVASLAYRVADAMIAAREKVV